MESSLTSCVTSTVVSHQKAVPFILLTNDLGAPHRLSGEGPPAELLNVQLKRVILPLHAGDASLYLRNHLHGLLGLPGCETTMLGTPRGPPPGALDSLAAATTTTTAATTTTTVVTKPPTGATTPPEGATTPPEGVTTPPEGATTPPEGATTPPEGVTTPPEGATTPTGGVTTPPRLASETPGRPRRCDREPRDAGPRGPRLFPADFFRPPAPSTTGPVVVVRGIPCGLPALRGGIRCRWGQHARTAASGLFRRYLDRHIDLLRDADVGRRASEGPEFDFNRDCDLVGASSSDVSDATEDMCEAEESEALYGQTRNYVSDYVPISCPPWPAASAPHPAEDGDPAKQREDDLTDRGPTEEIFTCWASNSFSNMPLFTLPLTGFALVAVSTHMVRRACLNPNAAEEELDKICDEFLCDRKDLVEMSSEQQKRIYEDGMKLMVAASFLQL